MTTTAPATTVRYRVEKSTPKGVTPVKYAVIRVEGKRIARVAGSTTTDKAVALIEAARLNGYEGYAEPVRRRPIVRDLGPFLHLSRKRTRQGYDIRVLSGFGAFHGNAGYAVTAL